MLVIPSIEGVSVSQGEVPSMPHNKFRNEWESWLNKVRGSHFKAHRKSGLYANMAFEVSSVAATAFFYIFLIDAIDRLTKKFYSTIHTMNLPRRNF